MASVIESHGKIHDFQMKSTGLRETMPHLLTLRSSSPCCWDRILWKGLAQVHTGTYIPVAKKMQPVTWSRQAQQATIHSHVTINATSAQLIISSHRRRNEVQQQWNSLSRDRLPASLWPLAIIFLRFHESCSVHNQALRLQVCGL